MKILITGGTGLVGTRLSEVLRSKGFEVVRLSRKAEKGVVATYQWDINTDYLDVNALENTEVIVHLAGAGVFDKRWSEEYKREILDSRVKSTELLYRYLASTPHQVKTIIGASAIGFYGEDTKEIVCDESTPKGTGFLADVVSRWEDKTKDFETIGIRTVIYRIGIVLAANGGALKQLLMPIQKYVGAPIGRGGQYVSWIHIDDLVRMIVAAVENHKIKGIYNAVGANPVTNAVLTKKIAAYAKKPLWLPNIPAFVLKMIFGTEKGTHLVGGNRVSGEKIAKEGFIFNYPTIDEALNDLVRNNK